MMTLDRIYHAAFTLKDAVRKTDLILAPALGSLTPKIRKRARKRCKRLIFLSNF